MIDYNIDEITAHLNERLNSFDAGAKVFACGTVTKVSDGVARVANLPGRCYGELLQFGKGLWGIALDLEEDDVGAVILNAGAVVSVGDTVRGTGHPVDTAVSDACIGRVLSPIGMPLDGKFFKPTEYEPLEKNAPPIISRRPIDAPLDTGILAIDSMIPIGKGQRELIIGDRQTGKTTLAVDTIINQKDRDVICIYCAIGQKASTIASVTQTLRDAGAMKYSCIIAATASDSPAMQYLAPYAACTLAEYFMHDGRDVLVVYDDLSKHAVAYRTMSLLLHRPPGREAYPGDVFYLHSRLLERSAALSQTMGGGSVTALPIIETTGGNISAYIPTNVISITDGQIYLEPELFHSGIRPAINTGLSVSRVGRSAQHPAIRKVSGLLRIDLAQYKEMAVFTRFGADIDPSTRAILENGEILTQIFVQDKSSPYTTAAEAVILLAYREGAFRSIPPKRMREASASLVKAVRRMARSEMNSIQSTGEMSEDTEATLKTAALAWRKEWDKAEKKQNGNAQ